MSKLVLLLFLIAGQVPATENIDTGLSHLATCNNQSIKIGIYSDGEILEGSPSLKDLASKKNRLELNVDGKGYQFNNNVIMLNDGFGNVTINAHAIDHVDGPTQKFVELNYDLNRAELSGQLKLPVTSPEEIKDPADINDFSVESVEVESTHFKCQL